MWWPFGRERKKEVEIEECEGDGCCESYPDTYQCGDVEVKGERAQQLHRNDSESREALCDIDRQIQRLKNIRRKSTHKFRRTVLAEVADESD